MAPLLLFLPVGVGFCVGGCCCCSPSFFTNGAPFVIAEVVALVVVVVVGESTTVTSLMGEGAVDDDDDDDECECDDVVAERGAGGGAPFCRTLSDRVVDGAGGGGGGAFVDIFCCKLLLRNERAKFGTEEKLLVLGLFVVCLFRWLLTGYFGCFDLLVCCRLFALCLLVVCVGSSLRPVTDSSCDTKKNYRRFGEPRS